MMIYIIRHAHALAGEDDAARPLSTRGRKQIRRMGRFLRKTGGLEAREFWHSPLVRSRDTAELMVKNLRQRVRLVGVPGLLHSDNPAVMAKRFGKLRRPVAVVGHEPHLGALLSLLVTGSARPARFELDKCAVAALEREKGRWVLRWLASPQLLKRR
jgi:phosphohistidine phosphatase